MGTMTLTSIKNFTVAGDNATAGLGYFQAVGAGYFGTKFNDWSNYCWWYS